MFGLGMAEVGLLLLIGMVLFGKQLPGVARALGQSVAEFRREASGLADDIRGTDRLTP